MNVFETDPFEMLETVRRNFDHMQSDLVDFTCLPEERAKWALDRVSEQSELLLYVFDLCMENLRSNEYSSTIHVKVDQHTAALLASKGAMTIKDERSGQYYCTVARGPRARNSEEGKGV